MHDRLLDRPPWYVAGALEAFVVVGLMATINERMGVLGGFSQLVERAEGMFPSIGWKVWFLFGVIGGGALYALTTGS